MPLLSQLPLTSAMPRASSLQRKEKHVQFAAKACCVHLARHRATSVPLQPYVNQSASDCGACAQGVFKNALLGYRTVTIINLKSKNKPPAGQTHRPVQVSQ